MEKRGLYKAILYSRVSTVHDEQAESIDNQILLAKNYLDKHPNIELAEPLDKYSERISGKTDIRPKFQEMCERLAKGDIHYLMIKDLKRLSRSVETTYAFLNLMKQYGFEIIQLSSGNIIDSSAFEEVESNLLIGIEALFAQNTVLTQSRYGKTVQRVRCENKILSYKDSTLFGYEWDRELKDIVIVEEKAAIIREVFNRFVFGLQSIREIREYLSSLGYHYSHVSVSKWLQEGKYVGDWTINRKGSVLGIGQGAKTKRFRREKDEWVHIQRPDLAIIDKDVFDLAQEIRLSRVETYFTDEGSEKGRGNFSGRHLFSRKVFCAECGSIYRFKWSDRKRTVGIYYDTYKQSKRDASFECPNKDYRRVSENELKQIVVNAIMALNINGQVSIDRMLESISSAIQANNNDSKKRDAEEQQLKMLEAEADRISEAFIDATSQMRARLNKQLEETEEQIAACKKRLLKLDNSSADEKALRKRLTEIRKQLSGWVDININSLDRNMVERLVSKIVVHMDGGIEISLALGGFMQYQLERKNSEKISQKRSPSVTMPSTRTINDNLMTVLEEVEKEESPQAVLNVMSFKRRRKGEEDTVVVKLDTRK
jgi:DNA invertase Pin-like site-specific DNA recombinase